MVVSLNYCSQNGGNLKRAPYYNRNPNIGPRIVGNLDQYPHALNPKQKSPKPSSQCVQDVFSLLRVWGAFLGKNETYFLKRDTNNG